MKNFLFIFINVILPIFFIIAAGYSLQKKFDLNVNTLSKVQMYLLIPSLLFTKIYQSNISEKLFLSIIAYCIVLFVIIYILSILLCKILGYDKALQSAFINSTTLYNSGNYCIPLIQLLYNNPFAFSVQIIVMVTQSILTNTVGIFNSSIGKKDLRNALMNTLKVPMVYIVIFALTVKSLNIHMWKPLLSSMDLLGQGLVPLALITLGAQLANTRFSFRLAKVYFSNLMRLVISPFAAFLLTAAFHLHGITGQVLVICSAAPSAVNSVLLALEYDNEPDFAAQSVFTSTILSSITVTAVIYLATKFI